MAAADYRVRALAQHLDVVLKQYQFHGHRTLRNLSNLMAMVEQNNFLLDERMVLSILLQPSLFNLCRTRLGPANIQPVFSTLTLLTFKRYDTLEYQRRARCILKPKRKIFIQSLAHATADEDQEGPYPLFVLISKEKYSVVSSIVRQEYTLERVHKNVPTHRVVEYTHFDENPAPVAVNPRVAQANAHEALDSDQDLEEVGGNI